MTNEYPAYRSHGSIYLVREYKTDNQDKLKYGKNNQAAELQQADEHDFENHNINLNGNGCSWKISEKTKPVEEVTASSEKEHSYYPLSCWLLPFSIEIRPFLPLIHYPIALFGDALPR